MSDKIYVILPKNIDLPTGRKITLTCGHAMAYSDHAILQMQELYAGVERIWDCDIINLQVSNNLDLEDVMTKLIQAELRFARYCDTDPRWDGEVLVAICTFPITREQGRILNEQTWKCKCAEPQNSGSSEKEQRLSKPEVAGSIPAPSSNFGENKVRSRFK